MVEVNLTVDGVSKGFKVPTSWDEVTVGQAIELQELQSFDGTDIEKVVRMLKILAPLIDEEEIMMMSPEQFTQIVEVMKFLSTEVGGPEVLPDSIMVNGEEYFLKKDFDSLNMGEMISINLIMKENDGDITRALPRMMCILLRKKVNGELESFRNSFMDRAEMFEDVIITDISNLLAFFLDGGNSLPKDMNQSSQNQSQNKIDTES